MAGRSHAQSTAPWELLAPPTFTATRASHTSLAFGPNGTPHVAYRDEVKGGKATVMRLNAAGTAWETVGSAGLSVAQAYYTWLAFSPDGTPYVAYRDEGNGGKATVMRLNAAGTAWEAVGSAGLSAGEANYTSLAFDPDGTPYVAYRDEVNGGKATVMRLNTAGTGWEAVGSAGGLTTPRWLLTPMARPMWPTGMRLTEAKPR